MTRFLGSGGAAILVVLVFLPLVAMLLAVLMLRRVWATDLVLRSDLTALGRAVVPFVRRPTVLLAIAVVVFGVVYFASLLMHSIVG